MHWLDESRRARHRRPFCHSYGQGNLVALQALRQPFCCDFEDLRFAVFDGFLLLARCEYGTIGNGAWNSIALNAYEVFPALAAAVSCSTGELIETPLNSYLHSHGDRRLDPYTGPSGRLIFHARGNFLGGAVGIFPRRFHQGHHRRSKLWPGSAHERSIGKN
jgi:hypothetical protein